MMSAISMSPTACGDTAMKSLTFVYLLTTTLLLTGCQSFQFVENPIPVTATPTPTVVIQNIIQ